MADTPSSITLNASEAIFAVADVPATIRFYRDILGFESEWTWGDPPNFGGVRWSGFQIMFCLQPELAARVEGHQHGIFLDDPDALYAMHRSRGAPILSEIENKPWGIREYTVRDPNGYHLRFSGPLKHEAQTCEVSMPDFVTIVERMPTARELALVKGDPATGVDAATETALANSLYGVVAIDTRSNDAIGCLRIVGDGARFFYIQDVYVLPAFQHQRIGSELMTTAMSWLRRTAPGSYVGLFTGRPGFYERFGFRRGHGMTRDA
jgi:catechol 2,3-dioxygenase-like lactoylglutathione lyase family enzyme